MSVLCHSLFPSPKRNDVLSPIILMRTIGGSQIERSSLLYCFSYGTGNKKISDHGVQAVLWRSVSLRELNISSCGEIHHNWRTLILFCGELRGCVNV